MQSYSNSFLKTEHVKSTIEESIDNAAAHGESQELYELDKRNGRILRKVLKGDGTFFVTRLDIPKSVSLKQDFRSVFDQAYLRSNTGYLHSLLHEEIRVADLFSGCGGLSLGVREACASLEKQFKSVLAVDHDKPSLDVYRTNFNPTVYHNGDIWELLDGEVGYRISSVEKTLKKKIGAIDILLAGPPCQGNSDLNNHTRRNDKRNKLYERVARFAEVVEPIHLIIENIPTVVHGHDRSLDTTIQNLQKLGYTCDAQVVNLATLGVPQRRKRHVLIASRKTALSINEVMGKRKVEKERTLRWAIGDLEYEQPVGIFRTPSVLSKNNLRRIDYLTKTGTYDLPNNLRPACHQDEHSYVSMYGRLHYDEPAQTITSGFGSPGQGRYIHPTLKRTLTPHEAARLQFFPDFFDFSSVTTRTSLAQMIGNAVPMVLCFVFASTLLVF